MEQSNKEHRQRKERNSAKKKLHTQGHNAKAFAVAAPGKMARNMQRSSDVNEKRLHVPMVDRTPEEDPPPVIVAIVGPPGTGKTILIKSLVRRLTKTMLSEINGPITVVSGKRRRLTFIECPAQDLNSMIDLAKIADLVLLMIDGNFGFEMETMEFLNIAQQHGLPRVLGVVTHLDLFRSQSTMKAAKKRLKHRFWTEVYQGAKLFYLSGVINGRYPDREILNLSRFISVMKFRPLKWRNEHPYMLADRITDLTHPEIIHSQGVKVDRRIALYGYLHGTALPDAPGTRVHIAGVGDLSVSQVEKLPDPCPTPYFQQRLDEYERERLKNQADGTSGAGVPTRRRKRLDDKDKLIYAPMSDVGGVLMDKDAVYIDVGRKNEGPSFVPGHERGEGERLVTSLQSADKDYAERFDGSGLQIFSNGTEYFPIKDGAQQEDYKDNGRSSVRHARMYDESLQGVNKEIGRFSSDNEDEGLEQELSDDNSGPWRPKKNASVDENEKLAIDSDSEFELDEPEGKNWELSAAGNPREVKTPPRKWDINRLIYMDNILPKECLRRWKNENVAIDDQKDESNIEGHNEDDEFFDMNVSSPGDYDYDGDLERFSPYFDQIQKLMEKWTSLDSLKDRFIGSPMMESSEENKDSHEDQMDSEELYGDFEDLENEDQLSRNDASENESEDQLSGSDNGGYPSDFESEDSFPDFEKEKRKDEELQNNVLSMEEERKQNKAEKEKLRLQFEMEEGENFKQDDPENEYDTWYELQKAKIAKQLEINNAELENIPAEQRQRLEGYKAGSYVRIVFEKMPMEFIQNFDSKTPIIMGGLLPTELKFGIINARIRRHRWHKKILKTSDPLILSLGWRRFQTLPIYTTTDSRTRNRMLKYTPEHTYCFTSFYGPLCSPGTPFCGIQVVANSEAGSGFRIAATGVVEEIDADVEIVKKLKLVGFPSKIFKNTAFIKDMFSTAMEVARFEGAQIKTVSGIRGEIKRALSKPEGQFRATFEDKILMSDIIILRSWYPVHVKKFYNPVTSLLLKAKNEWKGMRLTGQIRADKGIAVPSRPDSTYKKVERTERKFNGLRVPKVIQKNLPFKSQIHQMKPQKEKTYVAKRAVVLGGDEKKARTLMQLVYTLSKSKDEKKRAKKQDERKERLKKLAKAEEEKLQRNRQRKKDFFATNDRKRRSEETGERAFKKRK